ncbi:hypothetical protein, partial [Treponema endosymbiont of Eucomonympha sp.]|uniref:hypothetical protein n=1 Tax=Treponema endosymbiont of Eucomonympha sp. TaxID=1580831 RepID=UPI000AF6F2DB
VIKGLFKIARRGQASHPVLFAFNPESAAVDGEEPGLRVGSPEYPRASRFLRRNGYKIRYAEHQRRDRRAHRCRRTRR